MKEELYLRIILRLFLTHLLNKSGISIDGCFNTRSKTLTCPNQMVFIYFGHYANYNRLHSFYSVKEALIDFPLNYTAYVAVQWIRVRRTMWFGVT